MLGRGFSGLGIQLLDTRPDNAHVRAPDGGYVPPHGGLTPGGMTPGQENTFHRNRTIGEATPPPLCVEAKITVPAYALKACGLPASIAVDNSPDVQPLDVAPPVGTADNKGSQVVGALIGREGDLIRGALAGWQAKYPDVPPLYPVLSWTRKDRVAGQLRFIDFTYTLSLVRPLTEWDPELTRQPIMQGAAYEAALCIFWPDLTFSQLPEDQGKRIAFFRGTLTGAGPFPYWKKMISSAMIDFAVDYLKTTPDAFSDAGRAGDSFSYAGAALQSTGAGLEAGMKGGGPIGGAIVGASNFVVSVFSSWFSGSDPDVPGWLKKLVKIVSVRGSSIQFAYQAASSRAMGVQVDKYLCHRAIIRDGGQYTLLEGYEELLRRMGGKKGALPKWLWLLLASGAVAAGAAG